MNMYAFVCVCVCVWYAHTHVYAYTYISLARSGGEPHDTSGPARVSGSLMEIGSWSFR